MNRYKRHSFRDEHPDQPDKGPRTLYQGRCTKCGIRLRTRRSGPMGGVRYEYWRDGRIVAEGNPGTPGPPICQVAENGVAG